MSRTHGLTVEAGPPHKSGSCHGEAGDLILVHSLRSSSEYLTQETRQVMQSVSNMQSCEGRIENFRGITKEDTDSAEIDNHHIVFIENLEKDLSPVTIVDFFEGEITLSPRVYVFPSSSSESYARAAIMLDSREDLERVYDFLDNPNHMIVSSRGRPWVITKEHIPVLTSTTTLPVRTSTTTLLLKSQDDLKVTSNGINGEIKIVFSGSNEYATAKQLKDVFMEFSDHIKRLHGRLALEVEEIVRLPHTQ